MIKLAWCKGSLIISPKNNKIIYYELADNIIGNPLLEGIAVSSANLKVNINGTISFITERLLDSDMNIIKFIAVAFMPIKFNNISVNSLEEYIEFSNLLGLDVKISDVIKRRLTTEEYWDITAPNLTFTLGIRTGDYTGVTNREALSMYIKTYEFEPGMTMSEWCDSKYNVDGILIVGNKKQYFNALFYDNGENNFWMNSIDYEHISFDSNLVDYVSKKQYVYDEITGEEVLINFIADAIEK